MNLRQQPGVRVLACLVDPKLVLELLLILAFQLEFTLAMRVTFPLFGISRFASIPPLPLLIYTYYRASTFVPLVLDSIPSQP